MFCRKRPFLTKGNRLRPLRKKKLHESFSYPSGHATYGAFAGFLLAEMVPEKRAEIYARIEDYARSRLVSGVHFRSDVEAGKLLGAAVAMSVFDRADLRGEFETAKTCVRGALGLQ
ncbi:MAG: phosphatase PAP2 family protein [Rhodomicrobium sp.]|nr:phosphatase PAP2 family protein [Rhodomicrobium sp.]